MLLYGTNTVNGENVCLAFFFPRKNLFIPVYDLLLLLLLQAHPYEKTCARLFLFIIAIGISPEVCIEVSELFFLSYYLETHIFMLVCDIWWFYELLINSEHHFLKIDMKFPFIDIHKITLCFFKRYIGVIYIYIIEKEIYIIIYVIIYIFHLA